MCDQNELAISLRSCVNTCFDNDDNTQLSDCLMKCQAKKTENEAKCDSQKGKIFYNTLNLIIF